MFFLINVLRTNFQFFDHSIQLMQKQAINLKFNSYQQVKSYAEKTNKILLVQDDYVLDVTTFAPHHPGGSSFLKNSNLKNIGEEMKFHHPLTLTLANSMTIGSFKKEISRIIDPTRPFLKQIWNLDHQSYIKVVNSPHWLFEPSPRMFETDFMELFAHNQWYSITIIPFLYNFMMFYRIPSWQTFNIATFILAAISGLFFFTFIQYFLHRFIFHSERFLPDNRIVRYCHFISHGIHHMLPNDPDRLVLSPVFLIIVCTIGYFTVCQFLYFHDHIISATFWSFFLLGYVIYDICHYSLHFIDTSTNKDGWFSKQQRYHNQHHFGGEEAGYGVSSRLWDVIFNSGYKKNKKGE